LKTKSAVVESNEIPTSFLFPMSAFHSLRKRGREKKDEDEKNDFRLRAAGVAQALEHSNSYQMEECI